ncbi:MAG TPA: hypothetical protein VFL13_01130, partial [Candidatus Baltobacteraceae bacterium]|nr:hypothetical protein [Candidatus Baltobacteraceae bacterium]
MKISRASASVLTVAALSLLAACGGGGGGGGVTPPGGGNGGGGSTPTPVATATPTPGATATPTPSGTTVKAEENFINGSYAWYTSGTASWNNGAPGDAGDPSNAPGGPVGNTFGGMTCASTPEGVDSNNNPVFPAGKLTEHVFVGIYYNGTEEALPQALGMYQPVAPIGTGNPPHTANTQAVEQNTCEYNMHTHDYSGMVHLEDVNVAQGTFPSYANLQTFFGVSGGSLTATGLTIGANSLNGPVTVYAGTPSTQVGGNDEVTSYAPTTTSVQFSKHMAVWIVIGTPPASLPNVEFVIVN